MPDIDGPVDDFTLLCSYAAQLGYQPLVEVAKRAQARRDGLLEANTRLIERARVAEQDQRDIRIVLREAVALLRTEREGIIDSGCPHDPDGLPMLDHLDPGFRPLVEQYDTVLAAARGWLRE